ncbi:hypothetical protein LEMLEM_LOCUS5458 [Lemmus lemmus]
MPPRIPGQEMVPLTERIFLHKYTQHSVSWVIPNAVQLTVSIDPCGWYTT